MKVRSLAASGSSLALLHSLQGAPETGGPANPMEVSFADCKRELLGRANANGRAAYNEWRQRPNWDEVVAFVEGFTHRHLFELKPRLLRSVMESSEHPLGDVQKEEAIKSIEDFTCPFALQHIFHGYIEETGTVPRWQEFDDFIHNGARSKWLEPLRGALQSFPEVQGMVVEWGRDSAWEKVKRAIRWRLGKFYLSAIREIDLLTRLRELNVSLRYHLLADVLLRVDFWTENTLVCVYFENPTFRQRKRPTEHFFTGVEILHQKIERQGFGRFWLASDAALREMAKQIR